MANYKVAYGKKENINLAIELGIIPPGSIILTENSDEIFFYTLDKILKTYKEKNKFDSLEEAREWIESYDCKGQIFSVHEEDKCNIYSVGYDNELHKINESASKISYEFVQYTPSKKWIINHGLAKYPQVTIVDTKNQLVIGEVIYTDSNSLSVEFTEAIIGQAYLN